MHCQDYLQITQSNYQETSRIIRSRFRECNQVDRTIQFIEYRMIDRRTLVPFRERTLTNLTGSNSLDRYFWLVEADKRTERESYSCHATPESSCRVLCRHGRLH